MPIRHGPWLASHSTSLARPSLRRCTTLPAVSIATACKLVLPRSIPMVLIIVVCPLRSLPVSTRASTKALQGRTIPLFRDRHERTHPRSSDAGNRRTNPTGPLAPRTECRANPRPALTTCRASSRRGSRPSSRITTTAATTRAWPSPPRPTFTSAAAKPARGRADAASGPPSDTAACCTSATPHNFRPGWTGASACAPPRLSPSMRRRTANDAADRLHHSIVIAETPPGWG